MRSVLSVLVLALMLLSNAQATADVVGEQLGWIYLSRLPDGYAPNLGGSDDPNGPVAPFTVFTFYVVTEIDYADIGETSQNENNGLHAWEASLRIPPEVTFVGATLYPAEAINLVGYTAGTQYLIGLGTCVCATSTPFTLARYQGLFLVDPVPELWISLAPLDVDLSYYDPVFDPPTPGWYEYHPMGECMTESGEPERCARPFAAINGMTINCVNDCIESLEPIATEPVSWGSIKARY